MVLDPGVLIINELVHSADSSEVVVCYICATVTVPSLLIGGLMHNSLKPMLTTLQLKPTKGLPAVRKATLAIEVCVVGVDKVKELNKLLKSESILIPGLSFKMVVSVVLVVMVS